MTWQRVSEFFAMGGYALYVWGAFGVTAALLTLEPLLLRQRRKTALARLRRSLTSHEEHFDEKAP